MTISTILASGITALPSADIFLDDGAAATLILKGVGSVVVEAKDSSGYTPFGLLASNAPVQPVYGPMTFRVRREVVVAPWAPEGQVAVADPLRVDMDKA